jgi:protein-tyrosine-phosphatase
MNDVAAEGSMAEPYRILFVCTGNTCRSPMAEAIARARIRAQGWRHVEVRSAGTFGNEGARATPEAVRVAEEHGLDLSGHRSAQLTPELAGWADLVLGMTRGHVAMAREFGPPDRIELLGAFADPATAQDVPDPIGLGIEAYRETFDELERMITSALRRLEPILSP